MYECMYVGMYVYIFYMCVCVCEGGREGGRERNGHEALLRICDLGVTEKRKNPRVLNRTRGRTERMMTERTIGPDRLMALFEIIFCFC